MSIRKNLKVWERSNLEVSGIVTNIFNHNVFANPTFSIASGSVASFGVVNSQGNASREIQMGLRANFYRSKVAYLLIFRSASPPPSIKETILCFIVVALFLGSQLWFALAALILLPAYAQKPRSITTPLQEFGHDIGADYQLVNYTQETEYLKKLAQESDRMKLVDIGLTAEGRHQYMAIISSAENMAKLDHYRGDQREARAGQGSYRRSGTCARRGG